MHIFVHVIVLYANYYIILDQMISWSILSNYLKIIVQLCEV